MQEVSYFKIEPKRNVTMHNYSSCSMVIAMRLLVTATSHFRKLVVDILAFYSCRSNLFSGMEFNVDRAYSREVQGVHRTPCDITGAHVSRI